MKPEEIVKWALSKGWVQDKHGNLKKEWDDKAHRLKFGKKKIRYEIQVESGWVLLSSGFYKDLSISEEGKLIGMKRAK